MQYFIRLLKLIMFFCSGGGDGEEQEVAEPEDGNREQPESVERDEEELSGDDDLTMQVGKIVLKI